MKCLPHIMIGEKSTGRRKDVQHLFVFVKPNDDNWLVEKSKVDEGKINIRYQESEEADKVVSQVEGEEMMYDSDVKIFFVKASEMANGCYFISVPV